MKKKKIMIVFGTRPEAIKLAPLIKEFQKNSQEFETVVVVTAQHRQMVDQVMAFFDITADHDLDLMQPGQTLFELTSRSLMAIEPVLTLEKPDLVFIQGDTTTVFTTALACFYQQIPVAHVEAGLRSDDIYLPFPEEGNRVLAGHLSSYHFAPTNQAVANLASENIVNNVWQVGNTVIDSLQLGLQLIAGQNDEDYEQQFSEIDFNKKIILVTGHRRESFGAPFQELCQAIKEIVLGNPDVEVVYPVHLNPNVQQPVKDILSAVDRVHLIKPLPYPQLIWLMSRSYLVLTDSGGIQEEAPTLGKPVLVMRDVTERIEGIAAGTAKLVGTDRQKIVSETIKLLTDVDHYQQMAKAVNPYGDGHSSQKIVKIVKDQLF